MLLQYLSDFQQDPLTTLLLVLIIIVAIITAVTVHEFSHAVVADRLGDHTARR